MMQVPGPVPETMPVPIPTVAMPGQAQLHVPPKITWLSVVVFPTHILNVPVGAGGANVTVTTELVKHPVPTV